MGIQPKRSFEQRGVEFEVMKLPEDGAEFFFEFQHLQLKKFAIGFVHIPQAQDMRDEPGRLDTEHETFGRIGIPLGRRLGVCSA